MLSPRKIKFKKTRKISLNYTQKNTLILTRFKEGSIKIEALQFGRVTAKQLESSKASIHKAVKKTGNLELKVFPDVPVSKKPTAVRMGKGKGSFSF
jgi:large subunit ribosomal protein L16